MEKVRTIFSHVEDGQQVVANAPHPGADGHQTDAKRSHRPA